MLYIARCKCKASLMPSAHGSENWFVCADFCSDIKSLKSFLGTAYDKKSVRANALQSDKKSELRHPTMRPRLLLSHTIAPIKNRSVCADFWSGKKLVRFFSELLASESRSCALTQSEKKSDLHSDFFSELRTIKNRCAWHKAI